MALLSQPWEKAQAAYVQLSNLKNVPVSATLSDIGAAINSFNYVPILALLLWHTEPALLPPFTRAFTLGSLAAACYPSLLSPERFTSPVGALLHDVIGSLFYYRSSLDALFCVMSFAYKGIVLEARMGTRRFFNMVFLLAGSIGLLKFGLRLFSLPIQGGMYPLLLSLKVVINYTCLFQHPMRFPIVHPYLTRRLRFFEFLIVLVRTQSPQDILVGVTAGTTLIACVDDRESIVHSLLGEDGNSELMPANQVGATKLIFRGPAGGHWRWLRSVVPGPVTATWMTLGALCYSGCDGQLLPKTFNAGQPLTWFVPTFGTTNVYHLCLLLHLAYRVPAMFARSFRSLRPTLVSFAAVHLLTNVSCLVLRNVVYGCPVFALICPTTTTTTLTPDGGGVATADSTAAEAATAAAAATAATAAALTARFVDSTSLLIAGKTFAECVVVKPRTLHVLVSKLAIETALLAHFFPEISVLSIAGAYLAGSVVAATLLTFDPRRTVLSSPGKLTRRVGVPLRATQPKRQVGSVTESLSTSSVTHSSVVDARQHKKLNALGSATAAASASASKVSIAAPLRSNSGAERTKVGGRVFVCRMPSSSSVPAAAAVAAAATAATTIDKQPNNRNNISNNNKHKPVVSGATQKSPASANKTRLRQVVAKPASKLSATASLTDDASAELIVHKMVPALLDVDRSKREPSTSDRSSRAVRAGAP